MKKEELVKEFDNVKISNSEKTKIFNNIMDKRKNKRNILIPFVSFGFVAVILLVFFIIELPGSEKNNSLREPVSVSTQNIIYESSAVKYKNELNNNLSDYIKDKKIEVVDGLDIDANDVVESDVCDGTLRFKVTNGLVLVDSDISCDTMQDDEYDVTYTIFTFEDRTLVPTKIIDDGSGYIVFSEVNIEEVKEGDQFNVYNDLVFTKLDYDYNVEFNYQINRKDYSDEFVQEERIYINNYIEYKEVYYVFIDVVNYSGNCSSYIRKINKDGEFLEEMFLYDNVSDIYSLKDNYLYYSSYDYSGNSNFKVIVYDLDNNEVVDTYGDNISEGNVRPMLYEGDYLYAISSINYYIGWDDESHADGIDGLYKYQTIDNELKIVKEVNFKEILKISSDDYYLNFKEFKTVGDYLVFGYGLDLYDEREDVSSRQTFGAMIFDKNLNLVKNLEYSIYEDGKVNGNIFCIDDMNIFVENGNLNLLFNLDDSYLMIDTYDIENNKVDRIIYEYSINDYYDTLYGNEVLSVNPELKYFTVRGNEEYNFINIAELNKKGTN